MMTILKCFFTASILFFMVYISGCAVGSNETTSADAGSNVPDQATTDTNSPTPTHTLPHLSIPSQVQAPRFDPPVKQVFCTAPLTAGFLTPGLDVSLATTATFYTNGDVTITATLANGLGSTEAPNAVTQTAHHLLTSEQLFVTLSQDDSYDDDGGWWSVVYDPIAKTMTAIYNDFDLDGNPYNGVYAWTLQSNQCAEQAL